MKICNHETKSQAFFQDYKHFETLECDECQAESYKCISCSEFLDDGETPSVVYCCHRNKEAYADSVRDVLISQPDAGY